MKKQEETILSDSSGNSAPYVIKELEPEISGIVISCEGAGNKVVEASVLEAVQVLFGVSANDDASKVKAFAEKILKLRIFDDENGKTNKSIFDTNGEIMVVSNFTLYASLKGTNRPDFINSAKAEKAEEIYNLFVKELSKQIKETNNVSLASEMLFVLNKIAFVLGLDFGKTEEKQDAGESEKLLEIISDVRTRLRAEKNYQMSDYIRDRLAESGITVNDKKI